MVLTVEISFSFPFEIPYLGLVLDQLIFSFLTWASPARVEVLTLEV